MTSLSTTLLLAVIFILSVGADAGASAYMWQGIIDDHFEPREYIDTVVGLSSSSASLTPEDVLQQKYIATNTSTLLTWTQAFAACPKDFDCDPSPAGIRLLAVQVPLSGDRLVRTCPRSRQLAQRAARDRFHRLRQHRPPLRSLRLLPRSSSTHLRASKSFYHQRLTLPFESWFVFN
jgi:hypothetical protein